MKEKPPKRGPLIWEDPSAPQDLRQAFKPLLSEEEVVAQILQPTAEIGRKVIKGGKDGNIKAYGTKEIRAEKDGVYCAKVREMQANYVMFLVEAG